MESKCRTDRTLQLNEDQALWFSLKSNDSSALYKLYTKYYEKLFFYGIKLAGNQNRVADAIQDMFANIWETRQRLSDVTYVRAYLFAILRYDLLKPKDLLDKQTINSLIEDYSFDISPEDLYIVKETQLEHIKIIEDLLANLSSKQKEIIYLKFYNNYSNIEISSVLSIKPQSVANLLARTINRLRKKNTIF